MVSAPPLHQYSYLEYRMLEESSSTKHEFLEGEIYAMAGGTPLHAALSVAVATALSNQLAGSRCRVYSSDLRVRVTATGLATYPDATVICGEVETTPEDRQAATNPKVLIEVLSEGTEQYDRGEKLTHYKQIPGLDAIVLVAQTERRIEVWNRGTTWSRTQAVSGESVSIPAIQAELVVDAIYAAAGAQ